MGSRSLHALGESYTYTMYKSTHISRRTGGTLCYILLLLYAEMIHLFSSPHRRSYYDHHLVRSPRRASTGIYHEYNIIIYNVYSTHTISARWTWTSVLRGRVRLPTSASPTPPRLDDCVRQSYAVLCCASGSDLRFDERGHTVYLRVTVYAQWEKIIVKTLKSMFQIIYVKFKFSRKSLKIAKNRNKTIKLYKVGLKTLYVGCKILSHLWFFYSFLKKIFYHLYPLIYHHIILNCCWSLYKFRITKTKITIYERLEIIVREAYAVIDIFNYLHK